MQNHIRRQRGFASWLTDERHAGWLRLMDTSLPSPDDIVDEGWAPCGRPKYTINPRSIVMLHYDYATNDGASINE